MTIGLPLIGAVHLNTQISHIGGDKDERSCHQIQLSDSITLDLFTTDDVQLETGGSIWHAGKNILRYKLKDLFVFQLTETTLKTCNQLKFRSNCCLN